MPHKFEVGQTVAPRFLSGAERQEIYEIIRCLPDLLEGEPLYRIRQAGGIAPGGPDTWGFAPGPPCFHR